MVIHHQVLGHPGRDNALLVNVDTGQAQHYLLFDCGDECLPEVSIAHVQHVEALFFSHFHIDHIAGFDRFIRLTWDRPQPPIRLFGPLGARAILPNRLRGFTWNLVEGLPGEYQVTEIDAACSHTSRLLTCEGFAVEHAVGDVPFQGLVYRGDGFQVHACIMEHGLPCLAYVVREDAHFNVDLQALDAAGLTPGIWLKTLKDPGVDGEDRLTLGERSYRIAELRQQLLRTHLGDTIAYLTDFCLADSQSEQRLCQMLAGCRTIVCENNYRNADAALARRNFHMVSSEVGRLAAKIKPERLVLFHLSDRYTREEWCEQLHEVRMLFPPTYFPEAWGMY